MWLCSDVCVWLCVALRGLVKWLRVAVFMDGWVGLVVCAMCGYVGLCGCVYWLCVALCMAVCNGVDCSYVTLGRLLVCAVCDCGTFCGCVYRLCVAVSVSLCNSVCGMCVAVYSTVLL